jgi:hypothetical protein
VTKPVSRLSINIKELIMVDSNLHVVTHEEEGWAIKREGMARPLSTHATQKDAINAAVDVAQDGDASVIVHRRDGRIREVKSFNGNDNDGESANSATTTTRTRTVSPLASMGSRIRWGAVLAGFFVTLATSLALTALGIALTLSLANVMSAEALRVFAGVWMMLTLLGSLFLGGLIISRMTVGESDIVEPSVYGTLLWALTFVVLPLLPLAATDIGFGSFAGQQQQAPPTPAETEQELADSGLNAEQAETVADMSNPGGTVSDYMRGNATEAAWLTFAAILTSLAAAIGGSILGAQTDEDHLLRQKRTVRTTA